MYLQIRFGSPPSLETSRLLSPSVRKSQPSSRHRSARDSADYSRDCGEGEYGFWGMRRCTRNAAPRAATPLNGCTHAGCQPPKGLKALGERGMLSLELLVGDVIPFDFAQGRLPTSRADKRRQRRGAHQSCVQPHGLIPKSCVPTKLCYTARLGGCFLVNHPLFTHELAHPSGGFKEFPCLITHMTRLCRTATTSLPPSAIQTTSPTAPNPNSTA